LNGTNCLKQRLLLHGSIIATGLLRSEGRPCDDKATLESRDDPAMRWMNLDDQWAENDDFLNWIPEISQSKQVGEASQLKSSG